MAAKFLTEEWISAMNDVMARDDALRSAFTNTELSLQFVVTDVPETGDVHYYVDIASGDAVAGLGAMESPDATIRNNYDTAAAISKGELNTQAAFISGKLKVEGNLAKIMANQAALNQFATAMAAVDVEY